MGKSQRDKGARRERELVEHWRNIGVKAQRVPLSGQGHGDEGTYAGDVDVFAFGPDEAPLKGEVKARANGSGFKTIQTWLGKQDMLVLHADRSERLYVLPERIMSRLVVRR